MAYTYPPHTDHAIPLPSTQTSLSARIYPATLPPNSPPAPFIFITHGGGFIAGAHFMPLYWLDISFRNPPHNYHLISHSYRLAPQASLSDQVDDCMHVLAWARANLPSILGRDKVDVDRYVLVGDSAGGLLVSLMGLRLGGNEGLPAPRAIVDIYGCADIPGMLEMDRKGEEAEEWKGEFKAEELEKYLEDREGEVLTEAMSWREMEEYTEEELSGYWKKEVKYTERIRLQAELHVWRSLHPRGGELIAKAALHPERFERREEFEEYMREMSPLWALRKRAGEGGKYPPTAFLHGTEDEAVPVEHSREMAKILKGMGVPIVEIYPEGQKHVFDRKYTSADVPGWNEDIQPIVDFVARQVDEPTEP